MSIEACMVCGGEGRISNTFGLTNKCPSCLGSGRRRDAQALVRDVTKTKPSHHHQTGGKPTEEKKKRDEPYTGNGIQLATEVRDSAQLSAETKERFIREIVEYEGVHGTCTKTFSKKLRKKIRAETGA